MMFVCLVCNLPFVRNDLSAICESCMKGKK